MAISQRTRTLGTAASSASFTVSFPTGAATGDLVILVVANAGTSAPAAPTGWTRFYSASAGSGQNVAVYSAPWSAGLTGSFTNVASAAAWAANCYLSDSAAGDQIDLDANTASTSTTNNTSLPVGNPTVGGVGGCYEVLCYGWTSGATITTAATGTTIDGTQANSTSISAAIGHNNTTSLAAGTVLALGNATLSASNSRKTGVGIILRDSRGVSRSATPVTASIQETRRKARVSWVGLDIPEAALIRTATPVTVALQSTLTRTATPVTVSLGTTAQTRTASPVTASLSSTAITRTAIPVTVALSASGVRRTASPVTVALSASNLSRTAIPVTTALRGTLTHTATPVTVSLSASGIPRRARVSWAHLEIPDPTPSPQRVATPVTAALRSVGTRIASAVSASLSGLAPFPTSVSANGRYLVDQFGAPFFTQGNSPQALAVMGTQAEMGNWFSDQQARGMNSSQVMLFINSGLGGHTDGSNINGAFPFSNMSTWAGPYPEPYWAHVDGCVNLARQNGFTLWITIVDNISWGSTIGGISDANLFAFGQFIGNRYKNFPNIVWVVGNDWQPFWENESKYNQVRLGVISAGDAHLWTTWPSYPDSTSWELDTWDARHQIVWTYTYALPWKVSELGWRGTATRRSVAPSSTVQPVIFSEGNYENERNHPEFSPPGTPTSNETLRRTAWWSVTYGSGGHFFGQQHVWNWDGSQSGMFNTTAAQQIARVVQLMGTLEWWKLVPDQAHQLVTSGYGTWWSDSAYAAGITAQDDGLDPLTNDYATAAISSDRHLAVVYVPSVRSWVVETTALVGTVTGFWYDPTTGTRTTATAPWTIPATAHSDGTHDWVLVLQSTSRTATPITVSLSAPPGTRIATPVTVALSATPRRTASPVSVSLQGSSTRTSTPISASLAASNLRRTATPISTALATLGTRASSPVTASVSASGIRRTATPITASVLAQFQRAAQPVSVALQTVDARRIASPVTVSVSAQRIASPITVSLVAIRTASPVTAALSTVLLNRSASPITAALSASGLTRIATPVTAALQAQALTRTATLVTVSLSSTLTRTATPVTVALSGAATARLASPVTVALQQEATHTASPLSVALQASLSRPASPVTVALVRPRVATPVTVSLSLLARTRIAHPVTVALEREGELPPARPLTVSGSRGFGATAGGRGGLTVKEN